MASSRANSLKNLIAPLISIDQYSPKIQHDSIVVVFEVFGNYDAAYDLSAFIEKLPEVTLDTEARQTPNTSGNYEVFCEFERNADFPDVFMKIIKDVEKLGNEQEWNVDVYGVDEVFPLDARALVEKLRLVEKKSLEEFLDYSGVTVQYLNEGYSLTNNIIKDKIVIDKQCYFINEDVVAKMIQKYGLTEAHRVRQTMFPMHDVCQFVGTNFFLLEKNGKYLLIT